MNIGKNMFCGVEVTGVDNTPLLTCIDRITMRRSVGLMNMQSVRETRVEISIMACKHKFQHNNISVSSTLIHSSTHSFIHHPVLKIHYDPSEPKPEPGPRTPTSDM